MDAALTTAEVLDLLLTQGIIDEATAREARVREPAQRARLRKARDREPGRFSVRVGAVELLASLELRERSGEPLGDERITETVAQALGLPWRRLDPLDLDLERVTAALSRPFAQRHDCLVLGPVDALFPEGTLEVAVTEPRDGELLDSLRQVTGRAVRPVLATRRDIQRIIRDFYGFHRNIQAAQREFGGERSGEDLERLFHLQSESELEATDRHIVAACDYLLRHAADQGASDIHLEPGREGARVRYRIDGILHTVHRLPRAVVPPITSRFKMMARMDIAERRKPQDGRIKTRQGEREVEMRASIMPTVFGEKLVLRIFDPDVLLTSLDQLGFTPTQRQQWAQLIQRPFGIILLTGPTGSGKTTTLYSSLDTLAEEAVNIITIEDPIEMVTDRFNQVAVNPKIGVTFASALRTVLRQDPDIIMVGEIRDLETARYAVQAALTGHLVFSTLHTNDAVGAFHRLMDLGVEPFLVASTVIGVAAQRLVRRICAGCATDVRLPAEEARALGVLLEGDAPLTVKVGAGCLACRKTGYRGRVGIYELLAVDRGVRAVVHAGADGDALLRAARDAGMLRLREAALTKLLAGITSVAEVGRITTLIEEA